MNRGKHSRPSVFEVWFADQQHGHLLGVVRRTESQPHPDLLYQNLLFNKIPW